MREIRLMLVFVVLALVSTAAICWRRVDAGPRPGLRLPPQAGQAGTPAPVAGDRELIPPEEQPGFPEPGHGTKVGPQGETIPNTPQDDALAADYFRQHHPPVPRYLLRAPLMPNGRPGRTFGWVPPGGTAEDDEGHEWLRAGNYWVPLHPIELPHPAGSAQAP